jgi:hypothetical protein
MNSFRIRNAIMGGLLPFMNYVDGITDGISREEARQALRHLTSALKEIPNGPQLIENLQLQRFEDKDQVREKRLERLMIRRKERLNAKEKPEPTFAEKVFLNLLKVRDQIGYDSAEIVQLLPDEVGLEDIPENPLTRIEPTDEEYEEFLDRLFEAFPGVEWDEEDFADAMFAGIYHTSRFMKRFIEKWK